MSATATATAATAGREPWKSRTVEALKRAEAAPTAREAVNIEWNAFRAAEDGRDAIGRIMAARASLAGRSRREPFETKGEKISVALRKINDIERGKEVDELYLAGLDLTDITDIPGIATALAHIKILDCRFNTITDLPNLRVMAPRLEILFCSSNQLTALPPLPDTLRELYCDHNLLRALPRPLPHNLVKLWCSNNQLIYLPPLPSRLTMLRCNDNQLKILPELPQTLENLHCENNNLTFLPILPPSLASAYYRLSLHNNPFHEPLAIYGRKASTEYSDIPTIISLVKNYWEYHTVEALAHGMVNHESHLSAGTGKPDRVGYGFPSGPDANYILKYLDIGTGLVEGFDEARARVRNKTYPNPLSAIHSNLFKGGYRHRRTKRSKKSRRHTRRK